MQSWQIGLVFAGLLVALLPAIRSLVGKLTSKDIVSDRVAPALSTDDANTIQAAIATVVANNSTPNVIDASIRIMLGNLAHPAVVQAAVQVLQDRIDVETLDSVNVQVARSMWSKKAAEQAAHAKATQNLIADIKTVMEAHA